MTKPTFPFRLVAIESPYSGDVPTNLAYARACMAHSIELGEAPIASHLLYTQPGILDDNLPLERRLGINLGLAWASLASRAIFYTDLGMSAGMEAAVFHYSDCGIPVEFRSLPAWNPDAEPTPEQLAEEAEYIRDRLEDAAMLTRWEREQEL